MRNPKWNRDEIILALDLFFTLEPGQIHGRNPAIIELSEVLNRLPIFEFRPDSVKFRNPNGVGLKLSNFLAIDPTYYGKGMASYSKLDKAIFFEFYNDRDRLRRIANAIRNTVSDTTLNLKLYRIPDETEEKDYIFWEGKVLYKLHKYRERNSELVVKKKVLHFKKYSALDCEACSFNFKVMYGNLGKGYIECHHKTPLAQYDGTSGTTLEDLALVSSNCHRMLHRQLDTLSVEGLKAVLS